MKKTLNASAVQTLTNWIKGTHKTPSTVCIDDVVKKVETSFKRVGMGFIELSQYETTSGGIEALTFNRCDFD